MDSIAVNEDYTECSAESTAMLSKYLSVEATADINNRQHSCLYHNRSIAVYIYIITAAVLEFIAMPSAITDKQMDSIAVSIDR